MDTTTVNYAIEKLNEAFQAIKPTAVELGSEYVGYVVLKATLAPFVWGVVAAILWGIAWLGTKRLRAADDDTTGFLMVLIGGMLALAITLATIADIYIAILANAYPLMYTIEQLAK